MPELTRESRNRKRAGRERRAERRHEATRAPRFEPQLEERPPESVTDRADLARDATGARARAPAAGRDPAGASAHPTAAPAARSPTKGAPRRARPAGALVRFWWMIGGNAVLVFAAGYVALEGSWRLGFADLVLGLAVVSLVVARWIDVGWFSGTTADGEPATSRHLRRYAALVSVAGAFAWAMAHFLGQTGVG